MWMGERNRQAERTRVRGTASCRIQVPRRFEHDLFIEVELVGADAGASLEYRGIIVIPLQAAVRLIPIDGPKTVSTDAKGKLNVCTSVDAGILGELDQIIRLPLWAPETMCNERTIQNLLGIYRL